MVTRRRIRRTGDQSGQGTIEWLGVLLVVAVLLGVVVTLVPSLAPTIRQNTICAVQRVFQMSSSCQASPGNKPSNEVVCATSTQTNVASDEVSVLFVKADNNHTLIKTTYSDGEVQYTLVDTGEAELQADLIKAEGEVGSLGFDVSLTAAGGGFLQGSHTWTFQNAQQAADFDHQVSSSGGWGAVMHDAAGPVGGWILDHVGIHGAPNPDDLDPKNLTFSYVAAGAVGQLNAGGNLGLGEAADAKLDAELKASLGARYITSDQSTDVGSQGNVKKGDVQFFVTLSGNANAALQAKLFGPSATGSTMGTGTAIVTLGPDGSLQQLQLQASGQYTGAAGLHGGGTSGDTDAGEVAKALNLNVNDGSGQGYQYSGVLNLANDPTAKQALVQTLTGDGSGVSSLMQDIGDNGTERIQPYSVSKSQSDAGLELEVVDIGGGAKGSTSSQSQGFSPGQIKVPGQGWQPVICQK